MRPVATDGVAWSVCRSVGLSVTTVSPEKTAEPSEIPFGMWALLGPNHALDGVQIPTREGSFKGEKGPAKDMPGHVRRSIYSKRLSRRQHRYGADDEWGTLDGVHVFSTWRIRLNRPCAAAMRPYSNYFDQLPIVFTYNYQFLPAEC